jgi:hypothetical protein
MKNIHLIPTDKPSRLIKNNLGYGIVSDVWKQFDIDLIQAQFQNIYITDNSEIKEGDWHLYENEIKKTDKKTLEYINSSGDEGFLKIILSTDIDPIKDGVQAIDDEFLEWFVKNPSCKRVEVADLWKEKTSSTHDSYQIIIPQEEPKQETIKKAAKSYRSSTANKMAIEEVAFQEGAKWQQEQDKNKYSEEDIAIAFNEGQAYSVTGKLVDGKEWVKTHKKEWFENFKNK